MSRTERRRFAITGPMDLAATLSFLHAPSDPFLVRECGEAAQAVRTAAGPALVRLRMGTEGRRRFLEAELTAASSAARSEAARAARRLAGLSAAEGQADGHAAWRRRCSAEPFLAACWAACRGHRLPRRPDPVACVSQAVAAQQVTVTFARDVSEAFWERHGESVRLAGRDWRLPPAAERVAELRPEDLRALRFTRRKAEYVIALCAEIAAGTLDLEALRDLPAEEGEAALVARRGIGPTTAAWLLLFGAGHPDAWPPADVGLLRALEPVFGHRPSVEEGAAWASRHAGLRGWAALTLWAAQRRAAAPAGRARSRKAPG